MRFLSIMRLGCPRCLDGRVFRTLWKMHAACPKCGLTFEREPGFFYGALYFSYGIGIVVAAPLSIYLFLKGFHEITIFVVAIAQLTLVSPFLFRYSRVAWMHFDQRFDPR